MSIHTTNSLQHLADEREIIRVVDEIDNTVDTKDWATCRTLFTGEVDVDFTALVGGAPARISADALLEGWRRSLYADKKSHHMRTNYRVTLDAADDTAEVFSKGYALNLLPDLSRTGSDLWEVWGDYRHTLARTPDGWKCSGMTLTVTHARGNEKVREYVPPGSDAHLKGSCLCGAVVYEVDRLDMPIVHCHCETCRKAHAAAFGSTAGVYREHFRWLQGGERLSFYDSSPGKRRWFCSICGSHLMAERARQPHVILRVATLDDDPGARPEAHIYVSDAVPWLEYGEGLPRYPAGVQPETELRETTETRLESKKPS